MTVEQIRKHVGADTLVYQTMRGLIRAVGLPKNNFCTACFDGDYPIPIPEEAKVQKFDLERERVS